MNSGRKISELAAHVGGRATGNPDEMIYDIAQLENAGSGAIAFLEEQKFIDRAQNTNASCVIVPEGVRLEGKNFIEVARPKLAFVLVAEILRPRPSVENFRHETAIVAASARLGAPVIIGAYSTVGERATIGAGTEIKAGARIGADVSIGRDCTIHSNAVLYDNVAIGDRTVLHANVVIGADGFGYVRDETGYKKFPQTGTVVIETDVEIGAHTCIDRAAFGETRIGRGTKIDNLVQIAHNVRIGERVVIASQTGISGSTVIEDDCIIGGQVGFGDHARVERGAIIGSKAGVLPGKIVRGNGAVYWGVPCAPARRIQNHERAFGTPAADEKGTRPTS
jgi:UDP-3-O-[3-hydroxymyristoyl] glucosamine N-acyltransferase